MVRYIPIIYQYIYIYILLRAILITHFVERDSSAYRLSHPLNLVSCARPRLVARSPQGLAWTESRPARGKMAGSDKSVAYNSVGLTLEPPTSSIGQQVSLNSVSIDSRWALGRRNSMQLHHREHGFRSRDPCESNLPWRSHSGFARRGCRESLIDVEGYPVGTTTYLSRAHPYLSFSERLTDHSVGTVKERKKEKRKVKTYLADIWGSQCVV
ncbi:hypothetical protein VTO42DRAFT_7918 [Malbranchea cinnamomea]